MYGMLYCHIPRFGNGHMRSLGGVYVANRLGPYLARSVQLCVKTDDRQSEQGSIRILLVKFQIGF